MAKKAIDPQLLPESMRPKPLPPPLESVLPSGLLVLWRMPDPFTIVAFDTLLPDPTTQAVIRLLSEEKQKTHEADPRKDRYSAQEIRGMYGLAAAMLERPALDLSLEYGEGETLGRREIGIMDVAHLYWLFRLGTRNPAEASPAADDAARAADLTPDGDKLRDAASRAAGDHRSA